jgi:UDP-GlcNAc:undecaprenyl-phosphate GlcNAc-1-phosphate transferase
VTSLSVELLCLILVVITFILAQITVPFALWFGNRFGFVDPVIPGKIHKIPMVRCGGVGIYLAFMATLGAAVVLVLLVAGTGAENQGPLGSIFGPFIPEKLAPFLNNAYGELPKLGTLIAASSLMFFVGLVDDRKPLPPVPKLLLQILAGVILAYGGIRIEAFIPGLLASYLLTIAWVVILSNAINFLDNMDGLTAGIVAACTVNFILVSRLGEEWFMLALFCVYLGAVLGFLRHNRAPARLFMGDSGSLFLGTLLAGLSAEVTYYEEGLATGAAIVTPLIILAVPFFDTASVMLIRWRAGLPLMKGDQNHISHRLVALGFDRSLAVIFLWVLTLVVGLPAVILRNLDAVGASVVLLQTAMIFALIHLLERVAGKRDLPADSPPSS